MTDGTQIYVGESTSGKFVCYGYAGCEVDKSNEREGSLRGFWRQVFEGKCSRPGVGFDFIIR